MRVLKVATCSLNQWAMDFDNNMGNIKESIRRAKAASATIRLGPELEITGYGCEDHFLEQDTITHAWECLTELVAGDWTDEILCSFGMPVNRGAEVYNCQVLCLNRKIVLIRPKMWLANGGGCAELRWFTAWKQTEPRLDDFLLPSDVAEAISQPTAPFGYAYIQFLDTTILITNRGERRPELAVLPSGNKGERWRWLRCRVATKERGGAGCAAEQQQRREMALAALPSSNKGERRRWLHCRAATKERGGAALSLFTLDILTVDIHR